MRSFMTAAGVACIMATAACAAAPARIPAGIISATEPVFLISATQADQVLVTAMTAEFGDTPIVPVEFPHRGYQATIKFVLDSHQITGMMVPSRGAAPDGTVRDGFYFLVTHSGTMPLSGMARAGRLRERLSNGAGILGTRVPPAAR